MNKPENPQAFPCRGTADGMTLRDYFAAAALQGMLAKGYSLELYVHGADQISGDAYTYADAMLEARG